ncbi:MAG: PhzF family phenazine biosynthesis protein, partial [Pseudomonadota bacterium]
QFDPSVRRLEMNELPVAFKIEDELAWIGLPPINCDACAMPTWVGEFFSSVPWRAATAGASNGYLILEWPAGFELEELTVPGAALAKRTQRSVIATCAAPDHPELDIMLRYFAPNHGVPEDTATGSAMRVLASYWMRRELNGGLAAFQCSKRGGALYSRLRDELTWIGGRVALNTAENYAA